MIIKAIGTGSIFSETNSPSYLIDDKILIDIPNGTCKNLKKEAIDLMKIKHILLTHFHGDHYFDIPFYLLEQATLIKDDDNNIYIYTSDNGIENIKKLTELAFPHTVKKINNNLNIQYITSDKFNIDGYTIEKILVDHGNMKPAYGYILSTKNYKIGFTGDASYSEVIEYMASTCDYLICDCALIKGTNKHMGIDNIISLSDKYKDCMLYTTHMGNDTREELKKLELKSVKPLSDGETIKLK